MLVEYLILAKVLDTKDHHNKKAKLISLSVGWASGTALVGLLEEVIAVALDDQISYMLIVHGFSSIITLASSIALVYLVNQIIGAHKQQKTAKVALSVTLLLLTAALTQI